MFASLLTRTTPAVRVSFHIEDKTAARPRIQVRDDRGAILATMTPQQMRDAPIMSTLHGPNGPVQVDGFTLATALDHFNRRSTR